MAENIDDLHRQIKELENKVAYLNAQLKQENRFGLQWIDVPEAFDKESENKIPILEEVPELAITNDDGKPTHILIEGDNYHALTCLNYTHHGKVDVIYIDPPYNTGSDGFTYKDKRFLDKFPDGAKLPVTHPLRHSAWLSFMQKRLALAESLLSDEGIIFISIDDNEFANLRLLCDQTWTNLSFVTTIVVEMSTTQGMKVKAAKGGTIVKNKEYVLVYSKNNRKNIARTLLYDERDYDNHYNILLKDGIRLNLKDEYHKLYPDIKLRKLDVLYREESTFKTFIAENISNIYADDKITGFDIDCYEVGHIYKVNKEERDYLIYNNGKKLRQLLRLSDSWGISNGFQPKEGLRKIRGDWWKDFYRDMGNVTKEGDVEYSNGKKPIRLIKQLVQMVSKEGSLIMDFFAGSGTTIHSVLELNAEVGGKRNVILVQDGEGQENICMNKTYKRCQNTMKTGELGNSLKYYRTSFVGSNASNQATDEDKTILAQKAGCLLALAENTLYEQKTTDNYQIFKDKDKDVWTAVYFKEDVRPKFFNEFVDEVKELKGKKNVYIFSWGDVGSFESYFDDDPHAHIKGIPQPILDIYKSLNS